MILVIFVLSFTFFSNSLTAVTAEVVVKFEREEITQTLGRNDSNTLIVSGLIICTVEDLFEDYQYLKVYLYATNNDGWSSSISPSVIRFYESGIERFNASLLIPHNADNGTEVMLVAFGSWVVEPQGEKLPGSSGSVNDDTINIGEVTKGESIDLTIEYQSNIKGDYTIDYEFLNSMPISKPFYKE